ncbi:MAG: ribokinase [Clostridia bacterium]|nr:ribokinase [Clostridia bacterium]
MKTVYVFGSLNTDLCIDTPYVPKAGETLTGGEFKINFGGKGANQAVACAKLGGRVKMCGAVGDDTFGKDMVENLKNNGVDVSFVKEVKGVNSGVAVIVLTEGDNRIILSKGANDCLTEEDADAFISDAKVGDIFVTQAENPVPVIGYALKKAKEKGMFVVFNPAPAVKELADFLPYVDMITPNETECAILSGGKGIKEAVAGFNVAHVIVTLGKDGWYYNNLGKEKSGKSIKIKTVDTTAAGDTFLGSLCYKLSIGESIENALPFSAICAGIACSRKGAQPSIPTLKEVESFKPEY